MSSNDSQLNAALKAVCIYSMLDERNGMGALDEDKAVNQCTLILTSWQGKGREYLCMKSRWDDISEAPLVKFIQENLPRTEVVLRFGRQAIRFETDADEVWAKLRLGGGAEDAR